MRAEATEYIVLAVGGTGAKVAEAFVDLMTIGIPMAHEQGVPQAAMNGGDRFTIARVDTDKECRSSQLDDAIKRYDVVHSRSPKDGGLWGPPVDNASILHPLDALEGRSGDERLEGYLATHDPNGDAGRLLEAFYSRADLETPLHQGFFQCPDIGASVVGSIADLEKADPPSPLIHLMERFRATPARIFITGSLFGGTGAAGVPALARALKTLAHRWGTQERWNIGACLLGPYFLPPDPPVAEIDWGPDWQPGGSEDLDAFLARKNLTESEYMERVATTQTQRGATAWPKETLRQIARGYYAKRGEIVDRAFDTWLHYEQHGGHIFDRLYLLGLANPTDYQRQSHNGQQIVWANGGRLQQSPLHVVELAAARAMSHFFSTDDSPHRVFLLGCSPGSAEHGDSLAWDDLGSPRNNDFGRSMAAALVGYNWIRFTWVDQLRSFDALAKATRLATIRREIRPDEYSGFHAALVAGEQAIREALDNVRSALAWETSSANAMHRWCRDPENFGEQGALRKDMPVFDFPGNRSLEIGLRQLGSVASGGGTLASDKIGERAVHYLRAVWLKLFQEIKSPAQTDRSATAERRIEVGA